jgi:hypothetical protein
MAIKWLVQDTARMYQALEDEFIPLQKLGYEIVPFGVIPFTKTITGLDDLDVNDTFIVRGGTKIVDILESGTSENLSPELIAKMRQGLSYDRKNFDQAYYSTLGLPLLNSTPEFLDLSVQSDLLASFDVHKFVKPSSDLKAFTAGVMEPGEVLKFFIESNYHRENYQEDTVLVNDVVQIDAEYRFICDNGEPISGSQYRRNDSTVYSSEIPENVLTAANEYAKLYIPAQFYTMDLAETPNGIKIVEYNCWNCSGLYHMDTVKLFSTIQQYYEGTN